jgi:hypothetical protein
MITVTFTCKICGKRLTTPIQYLAEIPDFYCDTCVIEKDIPRFSRTWYSARHHNYGGKKRVCIICGKIYDNKPGNPYMRDCCSSGCRDKHGKLNLDYQKQIANLKKEYRRCANCGREFELDRRQLKRLKDEPGCVVYCSRKCFYARKIVRTRKICEFCGKPYFPAYGRTKKQRFCSRECFIRSRSGIDAFRHYRLK